MTRMAPLLRWRKWGNVSAPSPPTFYYRRDTLVDRIATAHGITQKDVIAIYRRGEREGWPRH